MPRDGKGNLFGHGSVMEDRHGKRITVVGFATIAHGRIDLKKLPSVFGTQYEYFRWTDLTNVNPAEMSKSATDTTDHCEVDRQQVAEGSEAVASKAADDTGDKVVWGT